VDAVLERAEGGAEGVVRPSPCEDCLYRQQLLCESLADVLDQVDAFVAKLQYGLARRASGVVDGAPLLTSLPPVRPRTSAGLLFRSLKEQVAPLNAADFDRTLAW